MGRFQGKYKRGVLMVDIVSPVVRSRIMSAIARRNTKPEVIVRQGLHSAGYRFRLDVRSLPGSPDIVLPKWRTVVFVHGCFWHQHTNCRFATFPATRPEFWLNKFQANVARDSRNEVALLGSDWNVAVVWECGLRKPDLREATLMDLVEFIRTTKTAPCRVELPGSPPEPTFRQTMRPALND